MNSKKIIALFSAILMALSITGAAYAHWEDKVTVIGEAKTGSLNMAISCGGASYEVYVSWLDDYYTEAELQTWLNNVNKDVVDVSCVEEGELVVDCYTKMSGYKSIKIMATNLYPRVKICIPLQLTNIGSIPAHWYGIDLNSKFTVESTCIDNAGIVGEYTYAELVGMGWFTGYMRPFPNPYIQIHPEETVQVDLCLETTNLLPECITIRGEVDLLFINWNEDPASLSLL